MVASSLGCDGEGGRVRVSPAGGSHPGHDTRGAGGGGTAGGRGGGRVLSNLTGPPAACSGAAGAVSRATAGAGAGQTLGGAPLVSPVAAPGAVRSYPYTQTSQGARVSPRHPRAKVRTGRAIIVPRGPYQTASVRARSHNSYRKTHA